MFSFFERLSKPFPAEHPKQPPTTFFAFCRHYTRGIEPYLLMMAVLTALLATSEALLYGVLGKVVDWLANHDPDTFLNEQWPMLVGMGVFILLFIPLIVFLHSLVIQQTLMGNFPMSVRWLAHRYLLSQSYRFFQHEFSGRIATKVMQTALAVRESVMKLLDVVLFVMVYLVTTLILVASADILLSLPLLLWLFSYLGILYAFVPRLQRVSMLQANARSNMMGRIVDSYTNIATIKLFSHSQREATYAKEGMQEFLDTVHPQMRLVTWLNIALWSLNMLLVFATGALGIFLWLEGNVSTGAVAVAISLSIRIIGMSHWVMWETSQLFENIGVVHDGMSTIAQPQEVADQPDAPPLQVKGAGIDFKQVGFAYNHERKVFDNFNLQIQPGEKIGLVGRSGAGKSSLVNLLLRFYDVQQGSIAIDGQDIRDVQQESLRAQIAMVTQDTSLLHRSVRENIVFGRPDATDEAMVAAAKQAQAHDFILQLQDIHGRTGYDAQVGERGVTLSGGQRQRIALARVLLKNAPILILDEATSALDSEVEASIQDNLDSLMQGKTVIAIAHRLSTIAAMDRLIVLEQGEIIEQGTHHELLALNGLYAQLWQRQSGDFLGE